MTNAKHTKSVSSGIVITPVGRLSYPHLLERNSGGDYPSDKYETLLMIPKSEDIKPLMEAATKVMQDAFGAKYDHVADLSHPPIRDGDEEEKGPEYAGHWFLKAKSDNRPQIVGKNPKIAIDNPEDEVFGGQRARLSLVAFSYKKGGSEGVSWALRNVQIIGGGEPYGAGSGNPEDQFDEVKEGDGF